MIRRDERKVFEEEVDDLSQFVANHAYSHQIANNPNSFTCSARCVAEAILLVGLREHDRRLRAEAYEEGGLQTVRDHQSREDGDPYCRWPTSPNPYRQQVRRGLR